MSELPRPPAILDILEEHRDELGSLWAEREKVVFAPDWTLRELAHLEDRAEAHLDGLRLGAGRSVDVARPLLVAEETAPTIAATFVLMAFERPELEREVLQALRSAPPAGRDGIRIGLRHSDVRRIANELAEIAASAEPGVRAAAADVLAFHRLPPPKGFAPLLRDPDPGIRRSAIDAAGRFGGPWGIDLLWEALDSGVPALRISALRTSARIGMVGLDVQCREAAMRKPTPVPEALAFLGVIGTPRELPILQNSLANPALAEAALAGLGALGDAAAAPLLLEAMGNEPLALSAARAFVRLTGSTDLDVGAPDPNQGRAWWDRERGRFKPEGRWQSGHDVSKDPFGSPFNELPLETRFDVYLGACVREPRRPADRELEKKAAAQLAGA